MALTVATAAVSLSVSVVGKVANAESAEVSERCVVCGCVEDGVGVEIGPSDDERLSDSEAVSVAEADSADVDLAVEFSLLVGAPSVLVMVVGRAPKSSWRPSRRRSLRKNIFTALCSTPSQNTISGAVASLQTRWTGTIDGRKNIQLASTGRAHDLLLQSNQDGPLAVLILTARDQFGLL
jgi:hypothetical protein